MRKLIVFLWLGLVAVLTAAENNIPKHGPLSAGPGDRVIAALVTRLLEESHYLQHPFDDEISSRFLDRYIDLLDPQHLYFLQSDLADFEPRRDKLDDQIKKYGDTSAAYEIANRFIERVEERTAYCQKLLETEKFEFNTPEKVLIDRRDAPFPKDMEEARQLWRDRLRAEVLQETLNKIQPTNQLASLSGQPPTASIKQAGAGIGGINSATSTNGTSEAAKPATVVEAATNAPPGVSPGSNSVDVARATTPSLATPAPPEGGGAETNSPAFAKPPETPVEIVSHRYNRILRLYREWDNEDALEVFLTALARAYDPHSDYLGKSQLDNFSITMSLSLFGIGARLTSEDGYCTIVDLTDGGPAKRSGKLKPKDRIVAVAQGDGESVDVVDTKLNKIVEMIRGPKGTEVRLTIIPVDAPSPSTRRVVSLVREEIKLEEQEAKAKLMELPGEDGQPVRLGLIDLPSFYHTFDIRSRSQTETDDSEERTVKSTSVDVARLLRKLEAENVKGVILDLRRNGGGSLEEAVKLTGLFIKKGPVVQVRDPGEDGRIVVEEDTDDEVVYDGPLLVLTSHFSASASEILAGALQDYGRAVIVGDSSTHGKGTVQALHQLDVYVRMLNRQMTARLTNDPGALKFTIRKFYRVSGISTQLKGVTPDIILPSVVDAIDVGEASLEYPLQCDTNKPANFTPVKVVTPYLAELQRRSAKRVATEKEFDYIREDYQIARQSREDKSVSLNLAERLKEKEDAERRKRERDAERLARVKPPETDYELSLKTLDQPGLPEPLGKTNTAGLVIRSPGVGGTNSVPVASGAAPVVAAVGTNAVAAVPRASVTGAEESEEDSAALVDAPLEEGKQILLDYLALLGTNRDGVVQAPLQPTTSSAR